MTNCETGLHHSHIADCHKAFTASWEHVRRPGEFVLTSEETAPGQTSGNHPRRDLGLATRRMIGIMTKTSPRVLLTSPASLNIDADIKVVIES